jgi:carbon monoxide dehydrogenase subunit G
MIYEHELEIERPPDDVHAFLSHPENLPRWQSEVLEVRRRLLRRAAVRPL